MRKFGIKIVVVVLLLASTLAILSGCGSAQLAKPTPQGGVASFKVTGSCDISISKDTVTVSGETDIMDGAYINISVVAQDGMTIDTVNLVKSGNKISQTFTMGDKYKDAGRIKGYISCAPTLYGKQTDAVFSSYGKKFEYIIADKDNYLWQSDGIIILFGSDMIDVPAK